MKHPNKQAPLDRLLAEVRACAHCSADLPLGPRPILSAHRDATLLIIGQAPGTRVHASGVPWTDPSGVRLRAWLDVSEDVFYDPQKIAIVPMGFCYPGRDDRGGDRPPRPECAPLWHARLLELLPRIRTTLLIGSYAQKYYLGDDAKKTLRETVRHWEEFAPRYFPTPHPYPRNQRWLKNNPWFEDEVVPALRAQVRQLIGS